MLGAVETYHASDPARHALLARLNAAYNVLDLREGWQSEGFAVSARAALDLLRPATNKQRRTSENTVANSPFSFIVFRRAAHPDRDGPRTPRCGLALAAMAHPSEGRPHGRDRTASDGALP